MNKTPSRPARIILITAAVLLMLLAYGNSLMRGLAELYMFDEVPAESSTFDLLIVPGNQSSGNAPSTELSLRIDKALELYRAAAADTILFTGSDPCVEMMKAYAMEAVIPEEDISLDPESDDYMVMKRLCGQGVQTVCITGQKYRLYRPVFDAQLLGIKAVGIRTKQPMNLITQPFVNLIEVVRRNIDLVRCRLQA